ncbi:hypothetical protein F0562_023463 [Nyssa sinensis]|uniref:ABC transporter domain-containing protein n=1 Tax=Nyssa sinensis TaxID=561372 RepID=A0A5J5BMR1_9ASTE|nr:hypothetical protein F0562_023463 [Nyssa sinensis]
MWANSFLCWSSQGAQILSFCFFPLQTVEESLEGVDLFNGGVADKQAGKYSGGMKRRLSVAISLKLSIWMSPVLDWIQLQDPVYGMFSPKLLQHIRWKRQNISATEYIGFFVDGGLQCIGNSKELKGRYGGSYVSTMTTSSNHDEEVENFVRRLSPNANKTYHIPGTQKFELLKHEVRIADVFQAVENAKSRFTVHAWGLVDTTLEDVFIKVAREARGHGQFSLESVIYEN